MHALQSPEHVPQHPVGRAPPEVILHDIYSTARGGYGNLLLCALPVLPYTSLGCFGEDHVLGQTSTHNDHAGVGALRHVIDEQRTQQEVR